MIDSEISDKASEFAEYWCELLAFQPQWHLDFSWPSLSLVDHILYPLRGKRTLSDADTFLLEGAAAYLARMAYTTWVGFPDVLEVHAAVSHEPRFEITLSATGGKLQGGSERFTVSLCRTLKKILREPQNPFPSFHTAKTAINAQSNLISLFSTGLLSGLCPYGHGRWLEQPLQAFAPYLDAACILHAESWERCYSRLFPLEFKGRNYEAFRRWLILPPAGYDEPFPYLRASVGLAQELIAGGATTDEMRTVAANLAALSDPNASASGFALAVLLLDSPPSLQLKSIADTWNLSAAALRPAVEAVRKLMPERMSWTEHYRNNDAEAALSGFMLEYEMNILPLVEEVILWRVGQPLLQIMFEQLAWVRAEEVIDFLTTLESQGLLTADLALQRISTQLFLSRVEEAERSIAELENKENVEAPELRLALLKLKVRLNEHKGELAAAFEFAFQASQIVCDNVGDRRIVLEKYGTMALARGELDTAQAAFEQAVALAPHAVSARVAMAVTHILNNRHPDAITELDELSQLAPRSPRVFNLATGKALESVVHGRKQ